MKNLRSDNEMIVLKDKWTAEHMLFNYIVKQASEKFEERNRLLSQIKTRTDIEKRQRYVRQKHKEMFGEFPEKTALNPHLVGKLDRRDHIVEKIIFESIPKFYVTANLYIPKNRKFPVPAILCVCGHMPNGKAYDKYQRVCISLAKKGYVVFIFDPIGQGERGPSRDKISVVIEHDTVGRQCFLAGNHLSMFMMWDAIRAIDYLCTRDEVDKDKIGITGSSGGGTLIMHLLPIEDRIKVAVPVNFISSQRKRYEELYGPMRDIGDAEQVPLNMVKYGIEQADFLLTFVPRPLQIGAAEKDYFSIVGTRETYVFLKDIYRILGEEEKINMTEAFTDHDFYKEIREPVYEWMNRWFEKVEEGSEEPPIAVEPEENLYCTKTGLVATSLGGETVFSLNRNIAEFIIPKRKKLRNIWGYMKYRDNIKETMKKMIGFSYVECDLDVEMVGKIEKEDYFIEKIIYTSEPKIKVPALVFTPKISGRFPVIIYVHEAGKSANTSEIEKLVKDEYLVFALDPRGIGETQAKYLNTPDGLCHASFMLGKTVLGMQVLDIIKAVDYVEERPDADKSRIGCIGCGVGGLLVMHEAALDERIRSVVSNSALISYKSLVMNKVYNHGVDIFIPHVLKYYDLPDIAALIAPRSLMLINVVDHMKKVVPQQIVKKEYKWTSDVYKLLKSTEKFSIESDEVEKRPRAHY